MTHDYGTAKVRPATAEDASALSKILRPEDIRELQAVTTADPEKLLLEAVRISRMVFAVELPSGELAALFGVADTPEPMLGSVWLLGSDHLKSIRLSFLRHSKTWLKTLSAPYSILGNFADPRNALHISWLRWLGFRFLRKAKLGLNGEELVEFVKLRES